MREDRARRISFPSSFRRWASRASAFASWPALMGHLLYTRQALGVCVLLEMAEAGVSGQRWLERPQARRPRGPREGDAAGNMEGTCKGKSPKQGGRQLPGD